MNVLEEVKRRVPMLAKNNLTPRRRVPVCTRSGPTSGSAVPASRSRPPTRPAKTLIAARRYEPLKTTEIEQLRDAALAFGPTLCADCDWPLPPRRGDPRPKARQPDPVPYLPHQHHGITSSLLGASTPPSIRKPATGPGSADLEVARAAWPQQLDFASLLPEVESATWREPTGYQPSRRGGSRTGREHCSRPVRFRRVN